MGLMKRFGGVFSALMILAGLAWADEAPLLDLNALPMALQPVSQPACGVSLAIDRRWPEKTDREKTAKGGARSIVTYTVGEAFHARDPRPNIRYTVLPTLLVTLDCMDSTVHTDKGLKAFADHMQAHTGKDHTRWAEPYAMSYPGFGTAYVMRGERTVRSGPTKGATADRAAVFLLHDGRILQLWVDVSRQPGDASGQRVPAGSTVRLTNPSGGPDIVFRPLHDARQKAGGLVSYNRTRAENDALIQAILGSLRPL